MQLPNRALRPGLQIETLSLGKRQTSSGLYKTKSHWWREDEGWTISRGKKKCPLSLLAALSLENSNLYLLGQLSEGGAGAE